MFEVLFPASFGAVHPACNLPGGGTCAVPIGTYDFADADDLGRDLCGVQPMVNIHGVTQGTISEGVYSAVFNGKNALAAIPLADRDVTFWHDLALTAIQVMEKDAERDMRVFASL